MIKQDQASKGGLSDLYRRLLRNNQEAFALGQYDAAYHVLMAAMHCAQTLNDATSLTEIEHIASQQLKWIDTHCPEYPHSTQSASKRGHLSIYENLLRQAKTRVRMIQRDLELKHR